MTIPSLKQTALLCTILSGAFFFQSCDPIGIRATGDDLTMTFDETDFHGLDLSLSAAVEVRVDSVYKVEITCEETAMPYVETTVSGGILKVHFTRHVYDVDHMKIVVSAPSWDRFEVSGSGRIKVLDPIAGNILDVDISGSGDFIADDADFTKADLRVSGSGDLQLAGKADDLHGTVSGSGNVDCFDFEVKTADLKVSGSGNIRANVLEQLDAEVSGSGDIEYKGNPQVNVHISGSGNVRKL